MGILRPTSAGVTMNCLPPVSARRRSTTSPACATPLEITASRIPVNKPGIRANVFDGSIIMTTLLEKGASPTGRSVVTGLGAEARRGSATMLMRGIAENDEKGGIIVERGDGGA